MVNVRFERKLCEAKKKYWSSTEVSGLALQSEVRQRGIKLNGVNYRRSFLIDLLAKDDLAREERKEHPFGSPEAIAAIHTSATSPEALAARVTLQKEKREAAVKRKKLAKENEEAFAKRRHDDAEHGYFIVWLGQKIIKIPICKQPRRRRKQDQRARQRYRPHQKVKLRKVDIGPKTGDEVPAAVSTAAAAAAAAAVVRHEKERRKTEGKLQKAVGDQRSPSSSFGSQHPPPPGHFVDKRSPSSSPGPKISATKVTPTNSDSSLRVESTLLPDLFVALGSRKLRLENLTSSCGLPQIMFAILKHSALQRKTFYVMLADKKPMRYGSLAFHGIKGDYVFQLGYFGRGGGEAEEAAAAGAAITAAPAGMSMEEHSESKGGSPPDSSGASDDGDAQDAAACVAMSDKANENDKKGDEDVKEDGSELKGEEEEEEEEEEEGIIPKAVGGVAATPPPATSTTSATSSTPFALTPVHSPPHHHHPAGESDMSSFQGYNAATGGGGGGGSGGGDGGGFDQPSTAAATSPTAPAAGTVPALVGLFNSLGQGTPSAFTISTASATSAKFSALTPVPSPPHPRPAPATAQVSSCRIICNLAPIAATKNPKHHNITTLTTPPLNQSLAVRVVGCFGREGAAPHGKTAKAYSITLKNRKKEKPKGWHYFSAATFSHLLTPFSSLP